MSVYNLKNGDRARIVTVGAKGGALTRLSSLGICAGKQICVLSFSLFKSSVLIACGGVRVGLRRSVAQSIEVSLCA